MDESTVIKLRSSDGELILAKPEHIKTFGALKCMFDIGMHHDDAIIPLPKVRARTLHKIFEWLEHHKPDPNATDAEIEARKDIPEFDKKFFKIDQSLIFEIVAAANYLDIRALMQAACLFMARHLLAGKTAVGMRRKFNIPNDLQQKNPRQGLDADDELSSDL